MKEKIDKFLIIKLGITIVILLVVILGIFNEVLNNQETIDGNIELEVGTFNQLAAYTDEEALTEIEPSTITLTNHYNADANYNLYVTVDKNSTIDYKLVKIRLDDKQYKLNDINYLEKGNKYYFFLESGKIYGNDKLIKEVRIWVDESYSGDYNNDRLYLDFATSL